MYREFGAPSNAELRTLPLLGMWPPLLQNILHYLQDRSTAPQDRFTICMQGQEMLVQV